MQDNNLQTGLDPKLLFRQPRLLNRVKPQCVFPAFPMNFNCENSEELRKGTGIRQIKMLLIEQYMIEL